MLPRCIANSVSHTKANISNQNNNKKEIENGAIVAINGLLA